MSEISQTLSDLFRYRGYQYKTGLNSEYPDLLKNIGISSNNGRQKAVNQINQSIFETNWNISGYIVEYEQAGHEKAEYGL